MIINKYENLVTILLCKYYVSLFSVKYMNCITEAINTSI